jgi:hypothetical protein
MRTWLLRILCGFSLLLGVFDVAMWYVSWRDSRWHVVSWEMRSGSEWCVGVAFEHFSVIREDKEWQKGRPDEWFWAIGDRQGGFLIERGYLIYDRDTPAERTRWQWRVDLPCWAIALAAFWWPGKRWVWPHVRRWCLPVLGVLKRWWPVGLVGFLLIMWAVSYLDLELATPWLPFTVRAGFWNGTFGVIRAMEEIGRKAAEEARTASQWDLAGFRYFYGYTMWGVSGPKGVPSYLIMIPCWFLVLASLPLGIHRWRRLHKERVLRFREKHGLCLECGYDLRASTERCPECGATIATRALSVTPGK